MSESEITRFLEGLPRRYLQLFEREAIYRHVQLSRDIKPDDVHAALERKGAAWELTVVTLDKPFLFSNICGVLSSFGMDILRGHAMTNPNGLVLDIFQFTDEERFLELNADGRDADVPRCSRSVVSGRVDVTARLRAPRAERAAPPAAPAFDAGRSTPTTSPRSATRFSISSPSNALGLLHRISRVISRHGCDVDLVLISTEGQKAIDVFHITKAGAKLSDPADAELTADLQRMLEGSDEAD